MKTSKFDIFSKANKVLIPRFEAQQLTSFSGLVVFQALFDALNLRDALQRCFPFSFGQYLRSRLILLLVVHILLGYRRLRDVRYYQDDTMVKRLVGLNTLPSVATLSRTLDDIEVEEVTRLRQLNQDLVVNRLVDEQLPRVTLDFDGTVQSTKRHAEGSAVGFNKQKKGNRSYYPLLCTVAQTSQILDCHHRPGNVYDSNGADTFISAQFSRVKTTLPRAVIEARVDSAFFNQTIIDQLDNQGVEFSASVPFARFTELKELIEKRQRWTEINADMDYFELQWKPKCWRQRYRFLCVRTIVTQQRKGPLQLDLFEPVSHTFDYKVVVTNKTQAADTVVQFHNGRGSQEAIIAELKTGAFQDNVPVLSLTGNQTFLLCGILAHNLGRELQMTADEPSRNTCRKRPALWSFKTLETLRKTIIQRAGRLITPKGKLTLSMAANDTVERDITHYLGAFGYGN